MILHLEKRPYRQRKTPIKSGFFVRTSFSSSFDGVPKGIRTPDRRLRRPLLYPAELWVQKNGAGEGNRTLTISLEG